MDTLGSMEGGNPLTNGKIAIENLIENDKLHLIQYNSYSSITAHDQLLKEITSMKNTYEITICSFGIGSDFDEK